MQQTDIVVQSIKVLYTVRWLQILLHPFIVKNPNDLEKCYFSASKNGRSKHYGKYILDCALDVSSKISDTFRCQVLLVSSKSNFSLNLADLVLGSLLLLSDKML